MKLKTLFILGLLSASASAAVTIGGTILTSVKGSDGATNIPTGTLGLLIVDVAGNGFFNFGNGLAANSALTPTTDPGVLAASANLGVGTLFGGETILSTFASPGGGTLSNILSSVSIAGFEGKSFAIVWFANILKASAPATAPGSSAWGVIRGADWVLPAADSGTFTSSATDANGATSFYAPNASTGGATTTAFRTTDAGGNLGSSGFSVVPEPSAALLGAIGALGLLRRRRN